ncbi:hypothetical protein GNI_129640 [Gregarina niphandrodes]|uniref:Uncharacterized protein n=1 Tax=Gregarina niphandrodes TaxID=110365 RepID=A0A023B1X2_GRENI|nr:hypothetical protein GNI_129640 [Gregarina niphandrodes]EZG48225.1 hypothetical protein GNI_129640 [Gregarina niphandrodes]|eukprot:XP_011132121.1 hypothetical protein GNI_129640 [Gregarina niphandrodes]
MAILGGRTTVHCFPPDQDIQKMTGRKMPFPIRAEAKSVLVSHHGIGQDLPDMAGFVKTLCHMVQNAVTNTGVDPVYLSTGGIVAVVPYTCKLRTNMDDNLLTQVFNLNLVFSLEIFLPNHTAQDTALKSLERSITAGDHGSLFDRDGANWRSYKTLPERSVPLKSVTGYKYRDEWVGQLLSKADQNDYYCTLERLWESATPSMIERAAGFNGAAVCINPAGIETADHYILPFLGYYYEEMTLTLNKLVAEGTGIYICNNGRWEQYSVGFWTRLKKRFWRPTSTVDTAWNDCRESQRNTQYRKSALGKQLPSPLKITWSQETL